MDDLMFTQTVMRDEWIAWRKLCIELKDAFDIDINENPRLHAQIVCWGERLAAMRRGQDALTVSGARDDAERLAERYPVVTAEVLDA